MGDWVGVSVAAVACVVQTLLITITQMSMTWHTLQTAMCCDPLEGPTAIHKAYDALLWMVRGLVSGRHLRFYSDAQDGASWLTFAHRGLASKRHTWFMAACIGRGYQCSPLRLHPRTHSFLTLKKTTEHNVASNDECKKS